jgi:hypothetical protein
VATKDASCKVREPQPLPLSPRSSSRESPDPALKPLPLCFPSVTAVCTGVINNLYRLHHRRPTSPLRVRYRQPQNLRLFTELQQDYERFVVYMALRMTMLLWVLTPCRYQRFRETYFLHLQVWSAEDGDIHVSPKRWYYLTTTVHGVKTQNNNTVNTTITSVPAIQGNVTDLSNSMKLSHSLGDDVDGVRLCLRTAATNGHIDHTPGDMWAWRNIVEWYGQGKLLILPPELSGNSTSTVI